MCYLKKNNSLLLACKQHKKASKNEFIWIFEYDLNDKKLKESPFLKINKKHVGKGFKPSGIDVHPDGNVFVTSGVSSQIIKVNPTTKEVFAIQLPKNKFPQVEGICFNKEGDMFLASEKAFLLNAKIYKSKKYE